MVSKKFLWVGGVLVVAGLAVLAWQWQGGFSSVIPSSLQSLGAPSANTGGSSALKQASSGSSGGAVSTKLTFAQAVQQYAQKRIQFDQQCNATPYNVTFKRGTTIMLENGANVARTISLDGHPYLVKADNFLLVTVTTTAPLPHTMMVDCGTGKNNATILIQE